MRYPVILADPPWRYQTWSVKGDFRGAATHYPTQKGNWIAGLPVADVAADNCALFLWVTWPLLETAIREVLPAWGFAYKAGAFDWAKRTSTGRH